MPTRELSAHPNLEHLKKQARELLTAAQQGAPDARARLQDAHITTEPPKLADALHTVAAEYGFATWSALKLHVAIATGDPVEAFVAALRANDAAAVSQLLAQQPTLRERLNDSLPGLDFEQTPLQIAVHHQNRALVDTLLDAGADPNVRSRWWAGGFGVLDWAQPELADHLIARGATLDAHSASRLGKVDELRSLLAADPALVHARGGDGQLPLHFAANLQVAELLLAHGAAVDVRDIDHESTAAQYMAADRTRQNIVRLLLTKGAPPDMLMAAGLGDLALLERLIDADPENVRVTVSDRYFPKKNPRAGGVIYQFTFGPTKSPHIIAHEYGHTECFALLMKRSAPWLRLVVAAELGDTGLMDEILDQMPGRVPRLSGFSARRLIGIVVRNNTDAARLLVERKWPTDVPLENGETALHYAAWHGNLPMVRLLLEHGAPVNVFESEHGGSPLAWALHGSLHGWHRDTGDYVGVAKALLAAGAQIPRPARPLEATEAVLEVIRRHEATTTA